MTRTVQIKSVLHPGKLYPRDADKMEKANADRRRPAQSRAGQWRLEPKLGV